MKRSEINIELAIRYLTGSASDEERKSFEIWLGEESDHRHQFEALRTYWNITDSSYDNYDPNLEAGWKIVSRETVHKKVVPFRQKSVSFQFFKIAVILLLLLAGGYGVRHVMVKVGKPEGQLFVYQSEETFKKFILRDGSVVWLNKHSEIKIPEDFNEERRSVVIEGEAYFEVAANKDIPFNISTGETIIEVVGTSFNVRANKNEDKVKVTVFSGHVSFYPVNRKNHETNLLSGDRGIYNARSKEIWKEKPFSSNDIAWKTGTILFKDASLTEVCQVLSDYFHINVEAEKQIASVKYFTGNFHKASLEEIIDIIELTLDIEFVKKGNRIVAKP